MTRAEVNAKLAEMTLAKQMGLEAENVAEEREFANKWNALWRQVQPYVSGTMACSDERQEAA